MAGVSLGLAGAGEVPPGSHLCALYSGPDERDATLFPFIEEGLRAGDDCLCLVDGLEVGSVLDRLFQRVDAEGVERLELRVDRASDVYLESGEFSADLMTAFLEENVAAIAGQPSRLLRAAGEMSWVLEDPPGADEFFGYESAVNRVVEGRPALFMCLYDLDKFGADLLIEVLRTHPKVLMDGNVLDNPYYRSPAVSTSTRIATPDDLVAAGLSSRDLAERLVRPEPRP